MDYTDYERKIYRMSNAYYNMGLRQAKIRDLTGAAKWLKKSLHYNKYQTDARNLLGLICYETGEIAQALVQWVISTNLQPEQNRANDYLEEIQGKRGSLDADAQLIRKFNQGLTYVQTGSDDLAVLQLTKVVEAKPNYINAQLLLALLYIMREEYGKAGKCLSRVLQTDRANPKAEWYLSIVKANKVRPDKGRAEPDKKRRKNVTSHTQMQDDDVILPPSYKESTKDQAVIHILIGLVLGAAVIFFLVMPARTKAINVAHNQEMISYSEKLSQANQEIDGLKAQVEDLEGQKQEAEDTLSTMTNDSGSILNQYKILINILEAYKKGDFNTAVTLYVTMDPSIIVDTDVQAVIAQIRTDMEANGYQILESLGDTALGAGDSLAALDHYLKSLSIKSDNWPVKYKTALVYKGMNQKDQANEIFTDIIDHSDDEALVEQAKMERGF